MLKLFWCLGGMYLYTAYLFQRSFNVRFGRCSLHLKRAPGKNLFIKSELLLRQKLSTNDGQTENCTLSGCDLPEPLQALPLQQMPCYHIFPFYVSKVYNWFLKIWVGFIRTQWVFGACSSYITARLLSFPDCHLWFPPLSWLSCFSAMMGLHPSSCELLCKGTIPLFSLPQK